MERLEAAFGEKAKFVTVPKATFKFGGGAKKSTTEALSLKCGLGGQVVELLIYILPGDTPLLISRPVVKQLGGVIDLRDNTMELHALKVKLQMRETQRGHLLLDLTEFPTKQWTEEERRTRQPVMETSDVKIYTAESDEQELEQEQPKTTADEESQKSQSDSSAEMISMKLKDEPNTATKPTMMNKKGAQPTTTQRRGLGKWIRGTVSRVMSADEDASEENKENEDDVMPEPDAPEQKRVSVWILETLSNKLLVTQGKTAPPGYNVPVTDISAEALSKRLNEEFNLGVTADQLVAIWRDSEENATDFLVRIPKMVNPPTGRHVWRKTRELEKIPEKTACADFHLRLGLAQACLEKLTAKKTPAEDEATSSSTRRPMKKKMSGKLGKLTKAMLCMMSVCMGPYDANQADGLRMTSQGDVWDNFLCSIPPPSETWDHLESHSGLDDQKEWLDTEMSKDEKKKQQMCWKESEENVWNEMIRDQVECVAANLHENMVNLTTTTRKQQPQGLRRTAMSWIKKSHKPKVEWCHLVSHEDTAEKFLNEELETVLTLMQDESTNAQKFAEWRKQVAERQLDNRGHFIMQVTKENQKNVESHWKKFLSQNKIYGARSPDNETGYLTSSLAVAEQLAKGEDLKQAAAVGMRRETLASVCEVYAVDDSTLTDKDVKKLVRKMHVNLGHPEEPDFLRILQNGTASERMLAAAKNLECPGCDALRLPKAVRNTKVTSEMLPFDSVGLDVKELPDWRKNPNGERKRRKFLNTLDLSSHLQQLENVSGGLSSKELRELYVRSWRRPYGAPQEVLMDPARANMGKEMSEGFQADGTRMRGTAGEAHEQNGETERAGQTVERILNKILDEIDPDNEADYLTCVWNAVDAQNRLFRRFGYSPYQLAFGRDPPLPGDLLVASPDVVANDLILTDEAAMKNAQIRLSARKAAIEYGDNEAEREALRMRPRPRRPFCMGDSVAFWRKQGTRKGLGRWFGPATVLGNEDRNTWVVMGQSCVKCSPQQLRHLTREERLSDQVIKRMLKEFTEPSRGPQRWFVDISNEEQPPEKAPDPEPEDLTKAALIEGNRTQPPALANAVPEVADEPVPVEGSASSSSSSSSPPALTAADPSEEDFATKRRRFEANEAGLPAWKEETTVPPPRPYKRAAAPSDVEPPKSPQRQRTEENSTFVLDTEEEFFTLYAEEFEENAYYDIFHVHPKQGRGKKEVNVRRLEGEDRKKFEVSRKKEIGKIIFDKKAVKVISPAEAAKIRRQVPQRVLKGRYVDVWKEEDTDIPEAKSRFVVPGHLDPDILELIYNHQLSASTVSAEGKRLTFQTIASLQAELELSDVSGAFMESDDLQREQGPL